MKGEHEISKHDLVTVGQRCLHTFTQGLAFVPCTVGATQVLNEDGRIVFTDPGMTPGYRARSVCRAEIDLRIDTVGRATDKVDVITQW